MLQVASTTDFSSKHVRIPQSEDEKGEEWPDLDKAFPLAGRGYGLVYCMGFIARNFGRMRIRSGPIEIDFFPHAEAVLKKEIWTNVAKATDVLQHDFPFDVKSRNLSPDHSIFPGTQILIEIPVEVWPEAFEMTEN